MSKMLFVTLMQLVCIDVVRVAAISLTISPDHVRINYGLQSVSFTCAADVALTGCQVMWKDYYSTAGPLLELSRGSQSQADPAHLNTDSLTSYRYNGRGLEAGECGVSLQVKGFKLWTVACRVREKTGIWKYAWADLYADDLWDPLPHDLTTPKEVVVRPFGEVRFSLKTQEPLKTCYFFLPSLPGGQVSFNKGNASRDSTGRHLYLGDGPGECGLTLTSVSEADNGWVTGMIRSKTRQADYRFMALVVARPPNAPTLSLTYTDTNVTATCAVKGSRPVAKISWVLGDVIIRQDGLDDTQAGPEDEWRWPWMQESIQQTLTLQLKPQHNGKDLKCRVSHLTLAQPLEAQSTVSFTESTLPTTPVTSSSSDPMATPGTTPGQKCMAANILDLLCQNRMQTAQLANTSCPNEEVYAFRVREAGAVARTAEVLEEAARSHARAEETKVEEAKVILETAIAEKAAKTLKADLEIEAARSHARAEEAWALNAEEELQLERKRRARQNLDARVFSE